MELKIYLDTCVYNRPLDDQKSPKIALETTAFLLIISQALKNKIGLINSFVLDFENEKNPYPERTEKILDFLSIARQYVPYSEDIEKRAKEIEKLGLMGMDALHIACAEVIMDPKIWTTC